MRAQDSHRGPCNLVRGLAPWTAVVGLIALPASAAPLLSGSYALTQNLVCQVQAQVDATTGQITIGKGDTGSVGFAVTTITFDSNTSTFSASGFAVDESGIYEKLSDGSHRGFKSQRYAVSDTGSYSNNDTPLTLKGFDMDVVYTKVENGIADGFTAIWRQTGKVPCVQNLLAQKQ